MKLILLIGADLLLWLPDELFLRTAARRSEVQDRIQQQSRRPGWGGLVPLVAGEMLLGLVATLLRGPAALRAKLQTLIRQECRRLDQEAQW